MNATRRTMRRALLVAAFAAALLVTVHLAYRNPPTTLPATGSPLVHLVARGAVSQLGSGSFTMNLADKEGLLTGITRRVTVSADTRVIVPGQTSSRGPDALRFVKPGYTILVHGMSEAGGVIAARVVLVSYPPVAGVVAGLSNGRLTVTVSGQKNPVAVGVTSHTAFYVPDGDWQLMAVGAAVRITVRPGPNGSLSATSVRVQLPEGSS